MEHKDLKDVSHLELLVALARLRSKYPAVFKHFVLHEVEEVVKDASGVTTGDENPTA